MWGDVFLNIVLPTLLLIAFLVIALWWLFGDWK